MKKFLSTILIFSFFFTFALIVVKAQTVGDVLTGQYTYYDPEGDPEYGSTYQWYRETTAIAGATNLTYTVVTEDVGHTLYFEVTPKSLTGITPGTPFRSTGIVITQTSSSSQTTPTVSGGGVLPFQSSTSTPVVITYSTSTASTTIPANSFVSPVDGKTLKCNAFNAYMKLNSKLNNVEEVKIWQAFLNKELNLKVPVTGYYGKLTSNAVKAFQTKYSDEVLKPWDISAATGYTYKSTRYKANKILGCTESPIQLENGKTLNY